MPVFQENTCFFTQSITASQPPCLCIAGWPPTSKPARHGQLRLSCKGGDQFYCQKRLSCDPPHQLELDPRGPAYYQLVAMDVGCLSQPSLPDVPSSFLLLPSPPLPHPKFSSSASAYLQVGIALH